VLLATGAEAWELDEDADPLLEALAARGIDAGPAVWDDPGVEWAAAELVVVRSTWDYAPRRAEFLDWARRVAAATTLANHPEVLSWNTDKRYLRDLEAAGVPVVRTGFVGPEEPAQRRAALLAEAVASGDEVVVKPSVSAGSKDTGRFGAGELDDAAALAARICAQGRTVMVQPYLGSVDEVGETGLVFFRGEFSHAFNKAALLAPGGEAQHGLFALERIAPATASGPQRRLAEEILTGVIDRFGSVPLYARVDLLTSGDGSPLLLELELTEPSWFLGTDPLAAGRAAGAIAAELG
jgi:glutathione synthase/RimK-type ligase-like ATP-grasp enzyme